MCISLKQCKVLSTVIFLLGEWEISCHWPLLLSSVLCFNLNLILKSASLQPEVYTDTVSTSRDACILYLFTKWLGHIFSSRIKSLVWLSGSTSFSSLELCFHHPDGLRRHCGQYFISRHFKVRQSGVKKNTETVVLYNNFCIISL